VNAGLVVRRLRLVGRGWLVHVKHMSSSGVFVVVSSVSPIIFATIAFYLFRAGHQPHTLVYAAIGAGIQSMWITTLMGSGQSLTLMRTMGMLELLVAAPVPLLFVLAPITLATATVGLYSLLATLTWGILFFDIPVHVAHPLLLVVSLPAIVFGLGMFGMVLGSVFVRFRYANALTNMFDYPIWLLCGLLVPVDLLPGWVRPLSWFLPPTWGAQAIRDSIIGGAPLTAIGACLALGTGYLGLSAFTVRTFEVLARRRAALALA
jgi:ABC-2 type transport system permease protein